MARSPARDEIEELPLGTVLPPRSDAGQVRRYGLAPLGRGGVAQLGRDVPPLGGRGDTRRRTTDTVPVGRMTPGDHFCLVHDTETEARAVVGSFVLDGVRTGQKVLYVGDRRDLAEDPVALDHAELVTARATGQLDVLSSGDHQALEARVRQAMRDGYSAVRITRAPRSGRARTPDEDYEQTIRRILDPHRLLALCPYDRRHLDRGERAMISGWHGGAVRPNDHYDDGRLRIGPLFTRPGAVLTGDLDATVTDRVLSILRRICRIDVDVPNRDAHLDVSGLGFCDAGTARGLMRLAADLAASGRELVLLRPPQQLLDLLARCAPHPAPDRS